MMTLMLDMSGWVANGPQQLSGVSHTCNTTTVGRVRAFYVFLACLLIIFLCPCLSIRVLTTLTNLEKSEF